MLMEARFVCAERRGIDDGPEAAVKGIGRVVEATCGRSHCDDLGSDHGGDMAFMPSWAKNTPGHRQALRSPPHHRPTGYSRTCPTSNPPNSGVSSGDISGRMSLRSRTLSEGTPNSSRSL